MSGAAGTNECPAGSVRIETEEACRSAAAAAGKTPAQPSFMGTWPTWPGGCFYTNHNNIAFFNTEAVGASASNAQLLCAAVITGAPLRTDECSCAGTPACAAKMRVCCNIRVLLGT